MNNIIMLVSFLNIIEPFHNNPVHLLIFVLISVIVFLVSIIIDLSRKRKRVSLDQLQLTELTEANLRDRINKLNEIRSEIQEKVNPEKYKYDNNINVPIIRYNDFSNLILNHEMSEIKGIKYQLVERSDKYLIFEGTMDGGTIVGNHYHDCEEHCTVLKGKLICPNTNMEYTEGDTVIWDKYETHQPQSPVDTHLRVKYINPKF